MQPHTSVYSAFCTVYAVYTARTAKRRTELYRRFSGHSPCFAAVVWQVHPTIPHRLRRAGAHHGTATLPARTRYHRHAGRCTAQRRPPIIIMYIRVQRCAPVMDPCQTVQHIADHASPAGSAPTVVDLWQVLHPAGQSSSRSAAGGAELLASTAAALFGLSPDSQ